jgi:uncharacterized protein with beta-barrel porin domain
MMFNDANALASSRRHILRASCAVPALLALPASLALAAPAAAQSTVSTNQYSTVNLSPGANPLTITAGTTLSPGNASGVFGAGGTIWQISNAGDIEAGGDGILLQAAGMVANTGTITGADALLIYGTASVSNAGTIAGTAAAVRLQQGGSVTNNGLITAGGYGILTQGTFAAVSNAGTILAGNDGISLNHGGEVTNTGTVEGFHMGIYTGHAAGTVENSGLVTATFGDAVSLYNGGAFSNATTGILHGGYSGLYASGAAAVTNAGHITGTSFGVYLSGAATLSNSGSIAGGLDGVIDVGTHGDLINTGEISGTVNGARMGADGTILNAGTITGGVTAVTMATGGTLTNTATGLIDGTLAGVRAAGLDVIDNEGTILGGLTLGAGTTFENSGSLAGTTAIALTGTDFLTFGTGSEVDGAITGGGSASQITLTGTGALAANLTSFGTGSALTIVPGADWTAAGNWAIGAVSNAGTLQPGEAGQTLAITSNFTQTSAGTLRVAVSPIATSVLAITGSAALDGHLLYVLAPGAYRPGSTTFLTATGGITGGFSSTSSSQPASSQAPQITPPAAPLPATIANTNTPAPAASPSTATPATTAPTTTPAAAPVTPAPAPIATPATPAPVTPTLVTFGQVTGTSANLVVSQAFTVTPPDAALYSTNDQDMTLAAERAGDDILAHATTPAPSPCLPANALPSGRSTAGIAGALANAACRLGGWAEATGTDTTQSNSYNSHEAGFLAGLDRQLATGTRLGLAIGYDATTLKDQNAGQASTSTLRAGLYAAQPLGPFILAGEATDAFATTRTDRATGAGAATARPHANIVEGAIALSAPLAFANLAVLPSAGLRIAHLTTGAATESAPLSAFALQVSPTHTTSLRPYASLTLAHDFQTATHITLTPSLTLGASYEADTTAPATTLTTTNTTLTAHTTPLARASGSASAGLTATQGPWSFSARYTVETANNYTAQTAEAALQMAF